MTASGRRWPEGRASAASSRRGCAAWAPPPRPCSSRCAREGFLVCEMTNHSNRPAFVYVQLNRGGFYGGTGLIGLMIRLFSAFFRVSHLTMGH